MVISDPSSTPAVAPLRSHKPLPGKGGLARRQRPNVKPVPTMRRLEGVRRWLERNARIVAFAIMLLLALALLRNGIAGLTS